MTKINKIVCDICQKEIDVAQGMSLFERIEVNRKKNFFHKLPENFNDNDIRKQSLDMCNECSAKIAEYIEKLKKNIEV